MPKTEIWLLEGKSPEFHQALFDNIYLAMRETFDCPEDDRFMTLSEHRPHQYLYSENYMGIRRSNDLVMIQITCKNTRTVDQKKALYRRLKERLTEHLKLRPEDIFVSLVEVPKENWSFGHGLAQLA